MVLIDEIDKAESDVPNGLLEALGVGRFTPQGRAQPVVCTGPLPLVVITTNEERELPPAFLRRCLVHTLALPKPLAPGLVALGRMHLERLGLAERCFTPILEDAAGLLVADRTRAADRHDYRPGLAEYLDLVLGLARLGADEPAQRELLHENARFTLRKTLDEHGD